MSYKGVTEPTLLCYVNKTFVYILNVEVKISVLDLKQMCYVRNSLFMLKMNKNIDKSA